MVTRKKDSRLFLKVNNFLFIFAIAEILNTTHGQCPWSSKSPDLHPDCICVYNKKIERLSIQCSPVNLGQLLQTLHAYLKNQAIDLLYINNSTIESIPQDSFRGMDIQDLQISRSKLKHIHNNSFHGLEDKLQRLSLQDNFITELPVQAIGTLRMLKILDLTNNLMAGIPDDSFKGMQLTTLKLGDNRLGHMSMFAFRGLEPHLKNLNLKAASITEMPDAIQNLTSLAFLDLSHNQIETVKPYSMRSLKTLTALSLEGNKIRKLDREAFAGINNSLSSLSFFKNYLDHLPIDAISTLKELRVLDLGFNKINELTLDAFQENRLLTLLALDGNPIETYPAALFQHLNATLRGLRIGGKNLVCDCKLNWIFDWIREYNLQVTSRERNPQFCGKPEHLRRKTFWQMSRNDFICENKTETGRKGQLKKKEQKKLPDLPENVGAPYANNFYNASQGQEVFVSKNNTEGPRESSNTPATLYEPVSSVTESKYSIHSLALTSKPSNINFKKEPIQKETLRMLNAYRRDTSIVLEWQADTNETSGFQLIYRYFGSKEIKKGPQLGPEIRKHTITHLPVGECLVVCVVPTQESQAVKFSDIPQQQCKEVRKERQRLGHLDIIVIAIAVAICLFLFVTVVIFSCCYKKNKKQLPPLPPPKAPSVKGDYEWETVSMYSTRSIPRARMYHVDSTINGIQNLPLDDTRSHYSHMQNGYGKHRPASEEQSNHTISQLSSRGNPNINLLQRDPYKLPVSMADGQPYMASTLNNYSSKKKHKRGSRLNSSSSRYSLTEYEADPWPNSGIIDPKLETWKDNEVDIYQGQNHVVPSHRNLPRR